MRTDGNGRGPRPAARRAAPPSPVFLRRWRHRGHQTATGVGPVNMHELSMYTEALTGALGVFTIVPYRSLDATEFGHAANFGDVRIGTKTLLFDCELLANRPDLHDVGAGR